MINRTEYTVKEKKDYELFYLKQFSTEFYSSGGSENLEIENISQGFQKKHPNYLSLVKGKFYYVFNLEKFIRKLKKINNSFLFIVFI